MDTNKTIEKALSILDLFIESPRLTLNEICRMTSLPKTTVHRSINSLVENGYVTICEGEGYQLGLKLLRLGTLVKERLDLRNVALHHMKSLQQEVNEAVSLIVREQNQAIYIEKLDTPHPVRVFTKIGRVAPLYSGACPRILLAYMNDKEREQILSSIEWKRYTSKTIMSTEELDPLLRNIRINGYSVSHSELTEGSSAVGAPIYDHKGTVVAGLSVAGPSQRFTEEALPNLIEATVRTACRISEALGYRT